MIPILSGLSAAVLWGGSTLAASRSTRIIGAQQALAYVMLFGLVATSVAVAVSGPPPHPSPRALGWALLGGVASAVGLGMMYRALRHGKVGVVAPIASTEGALAAMFSVAFLGEQLTAGVVVCLAVIAAGVVLVTLHGRRSDVHLRPSLDALAAACAFGVGLVASSQAGHGLGAFWTILVARVVGVAVIACPLILRGVLRRPGAAWWLVLFSGLAELFGFAAYIYGSRGGAAIPAVLASQFAAVATIGSFLLFGERLRGRQLAAGAVIIAGVGGLALLRA
ncbi:MAG: EamA family transporter [Gaiellales bacterium]